MHAPNTSLLSQRAMLASLSIAVWSGRKLDKSVSDQATAAHNAASDSGRFHKRLVSKHALAEIAQIVSEARTVHYARTLPWHDNGQRLLSSVGFLDHAETLRKSKAQFEAAADKFLAGYSDFVDDARVSLGAMFRASDYPPVSDVRGRFKFDVVHMNCPDAADFRVAVGEEQAAEIKADIEARTRDALAAAMRDVWERIAKGVGHMSERLKAYKPAAGKGDRSENVFRDSLVENVRELVALLPALNITGDPALAAMGERIAADLCRDDATTLRDNGSARQSVAAAADAILATVNDYLS